MVVNSRAGGILKPEVGEVSEMCGARAELTTKVRNNLGLSSCAMSRSAVAYVVAYFRRTELLPGVQERNGILIRVRIEHVKDIIDINL